MQQGKFFRVIRQLGRYITRPYEVVWREGQPPNPAVFLCRHLNQHGPIVSLIWMPPVRFWGLHVYSDRELCRRHFADFTLPQRCGLPKWLANLVAFPVGRIMTGLAVSGQSIPVYRDSNSFKTIGDSVKALKQGDNLLIFPDIDYTNREGGTELYDGFLYLERFFFRSAGQHVNFVPLFIDDVERQIIAGEAVRFADGDFAEQKERVMAQLSRALAGDFSGRPEEKLHNFRQRGA